MKQLYYILSGILLLLFLSFISLDEKETNILINADFELADHAWNHWWGLEIDKDTRHSGELACKITAQKDAWRGTTQVIDCPKGAKTLKVSAWMKTEKISPIGEAWNNARISVDFKKEADTKDKIGKNPLVAGVIGTTDWKQYSTFYTVPEECNFIDVGIMCGTATGTVWVDDIKVTVFE